MISLLARRTLLWCLCVPALPGIAQTPGGEPAGLLILARPAIAEAWAGELAGGSAPLGTLVADLGAVGRGAVRPLLATPAADADLAGALGIDRLFVAACPPGIGAPEFQRVLRERRDLVEGVWLDDVTHVHSDESAPAPDDPLFADQYNLLNSGQVVDGQPGLPGADIDAPGAWRFALGEGVIVAVLDAGVSRSHPDLAGKLLPGWNCLDHSYHTDDLYNSHGTHVAGIIAAASDNGEGMAGIAWDALILPVVVVNRYGFGSESVLAEGLIWAADHGGRVASVSLGFNPDHGSDEDRVLHAAVEYATLRGMLICASAGNTPGADIGAPARYPEVLAVGATDNRDELWPNTSTGPEIDLAAPGVSIWSTWDSEWNADDENTYAQKTGTSQACPHAAGAAALVLSVDPRLRPAEVRAILESSAADLGPPGWDEGYGSGRLDAGGAVSAAVAGAHHVGDDEARCVADFNGDGRVDAQDLIRYINAYARQSRRADIAEPFGVLDVRDFIAFLGAHAQGCEP